MSRKHFRSIRRYFRREEEYSAEERAKVDLCRNTTSVHRMGTLRCKLGRLFGYPHCEPIPNEGIKLSARSTADYGNVQLSLEDTRLVNCLVMVKHFPDTALLLKPAIAVMESMDEMDRRIVYQCQESVKRTNLLLSYQKIKDELCLYPEEHSRLFTKVVGMLVFHLGTLSIDQRLVYLGIERYTLPKYKQGLKSGRGEEGRKEGREGQESKKRTERGKRKLNNEIMSRQ